MDDQTGRLVDDEEMVILEHDNEGDLLRFGARPHRGRQIDVKDIANRDPVIRVEKRTPSGTFNLTLGDEVLDPRPG